MKKLVFIALLTASLLPCVSAKNKETYKITFTVKNSKDSVMYMGFYYANNTLAFDTAFRNKKDQFIFRGTKEIKPGMYFFSNPQGRYTEFIVGSDKPEYTFKTDDANWISHMQVSGSPENADYYEIQNMTRAYYTIIDSIIKATPDKNTAREKTEPWKKQLDSLTEQYGITHPDYLIAKMFTARKRVEVPKFNEKGDSLTLTERAEYYGKHYFDNMALDCNGFVRTPAPIFYDQICRFFDEYLKTATPEVICEYADMMIEKSRPAKEVFQYLVHYVTEKYLRSNVMSHDAVYVHMIEKYYASGDAFWAKPSDIDAEVQRASKWKRLLVGETAPLFGVFDNEEWHFLNEVKNKYTLLIFWSPTCGHCATIIPAVYEFYEKNKDKYDIGTFAINTEIGEIEKWHKFIEDHHLQWNNLNGGVANVDWKNLYDITTTPVIYLLDKDKKILAKKIDAKMLAEIFKIIEPE